MQVQHIPTSWPDEVIKYPRLMRLIAHPDVVVLFDKPKSGTCLASNPAGNTHGYKIGEYCNDRYMKAFEDYRDILQMKNDAR